MEPIFNQLPKGLGGMQVVCSHAVKSRIQSNPSMSPPPPHLMRQESAAESEDGREGGEGRVWKGRVGACCWAPRPRRLHVAQG